MNTFNTQLTGQLGIAIAITALSSIVTLILLYSGIPFFGPVNDITTAVGGLLSAVLAWQFYILVRDHTPGLANILLLGAWVGAAAIILNSLLVAFGRMHWMTGGMYTGIGYGLLGLGLLALLRSTAVEPFLANGLVRFGSITAVALLFGLLAGPFLASGVAFTKNPVTFVAYLGAAAGWLLYPVWCWQVGRRLLSL